MFKGIPIPSTLVLRKANNDDVLQLVDIEKSLNPWGWTQQNFVDALQHHECWVLCDKHNAHQTIGYLILQTIMDELHLLNISIAKPFQGHRYGKLLMDVVIQQATLKLSSVIYLELRASNKVARNLYRNYGFEQTGTRKGYYRTDGIPEDARLMSKLIG